MKNRKIFAIALITLCLSISLSVTSFAFDSNAKDWKILSERTGIDINGLKDSYSKMNEDEFIKATNYLSNNMNTYLNHTTPTTYGLPNIMNDAKWRMYRNNLTLGSILITSDEYTSVFQHGHAAIISYANNMGASDSMNKIFYITEHPGSLTNGGLSWRVVLGNSQSSTYWRRANNSAIMKVSDNTAMNIAGSKAYSKIDIAYLPLASKDNRQFVNCSSLGYQAYKDSGIDISNNSSTIVLPVDIARDSVTSIVFENGNFPWK